MNRTVKSFLVGYNPINESNVFSNGDVIRGQVMLELTKDTDVNALGVKLKGKAEVRWTEKHGKRRVTYHSKEKYFSIQQLFFQKDRGNNHVSRGTAVYPFTFQIPAQDLPPSFKGQWGRIVYTLEACLSRPMRLDSKTSTEFLLVSKTRVMDPSLMVPQHGVKDKQLKLFNSGYVAMDVNIDKTGFQQGEGIRVVASIQNKSSRDVRPKYCIYTKHSFFARGKRRLQTMDVLKDVGDAIPPSAGQTITKVINVPATLYPSIHNCNNIKVEYRLRVYLDVKYVSDPEIKFPISVFSAFSLW
uniref:Arrestin C-terminal-like domain-containing protein n=1 Tax=Knipowitschia caucasica TaxID=637954 RepID=A0AAV2MSL1_KNICA